MQTLSNYPPGCSGHIYSYQSDARCALGHTWEQSWEDELGGSFLISGDACPECGLPDGDLHCTLCGERLTADEVFDCHMWRDGKAFNQRELECRKCVEPAAQLEVVVA